METQETALEQAVACRIRPRKGMEWRGRRYARGEILSLPLMAGYVLHLCEVVEMLPGHRTALTRPVPVLVESTLPAFDAPVPASRPLAA
jgi:hypothetical protein